MYDDERTIQCVLADDRKASRALIIRRESAVAAVVRALSLGGSDWEGIAQLVFIAGFQHLASFDESHGSFRALLLAIARNKMSQ